MKNKKDFLLYYQKEYKMILDRKVDELKKEYYKKLKVIILEQVMYFIVFVLLIILFGDNSILTLLLIFLLMILFGFTLFINYKLLDNQKKDISYQINIVIYQDILSFLTNDYLYEENTQLAIEDFNKMGLFNLDILNYEGCNFTGVNIDNKRFLYCDVLLYTTREKILQDKYYDESDDILYITNYHYDEEIPIFKGLYYEMNISKKNKDYVYLIPNNFNDKFINKNIYHYISFKGNKIELENIAFNEKYQVYSFNELKSRYLLSLTLMEKINELDKLVSNKKYYVFKKDGRVGIFINDFTIDNLLKKENNWQKGISEKYLGDFFNKISYLLRINEILDEK